MIQTHANKILTLHVNDPGTDRPTTINFIISFLFACFLLHTLMQTSVLYLISPFMLNRALYRHIFHTHANAYASLLLICVCVCVPLCVYVRRYSHQRPGGGEEGGGLCYTRVPIGRCRGDGEGLDPELKSGRSRRFIIKPV